MLYTKRSLQLIIFCLTLILCTLALGRILRVWAEDSSSSSTIGEDNISTSSDDMMSSESSESTSSESALAKSGFGLGAGRSAELESAKTRLMNNESLSSTARQQAIAGLQQQNAQQLCTILTTNFAARLESFDSIYQNRSALNSKLVNSLNRVETALQNAGVDTTNLSTAISTLSADISDYDKAYANLVNKLSLAQANACDQSQVTSYKQAVLQAVDLVKTWRTSQQTLINFIKGELKTLVQNIRAQYLARSSSTSSASDSNLSSSSST